MLTRRIALEAALVLAGVFVVAFLAGRGSAQTGEAGEPRPERAPARFQPPDSGLEPPQGLTPITLPALKAEPEVASRDEAPAGAVPPPPADPVPPAATPAPPAPQEPGPVTPPTPPEPLPGPVEPPPEPQ